MDLLDQLQAELGSTYTIDRELSGGGMSRVFVATEIALGRSVVIKVLHPELAAGVTTERFAREIQLVARLQQANIVPLIAAGLTSSGPFYTMPLVEGASLRQRIAERGPLAIGDAVSILRDVARALAYAHDAGVIHRDIKPENVLLSGGAAVVTDFGIAKAVCASRLDDAANMTITQVGMGVGTPAYMAPEQASGDPSVDHRADIYAFGCLAYELLTGRPPFHSRSVHQLIAAQIAEPPVPVAAQRAGIDPALASLVDRCLEKHVDRRPQSARELLEALDSLGTPTRSGTARPLQRRGLAIAGAAILLLATVAYVAIGRRGSSPAAGADPSLAVIPFVNVGGDSAQDYLADGVSDALATAIGKLPGVRLTARSAAYRFRGQRDVRVQEVGKKLQAEFLVQGTLRRVGDQLRISAQLSDASSGQELWSATFDRTSGDVLRTQDDITAAIAKALASRLRPSAAAARPPGQGTDNPVAYDRYLRGEFLLRRRQIPGAIEMYQSAISSDTNFARAYAGLSQALALTTYYAATPPDSIRGRVIAAANRALARDSGLAEAHMSLGLAYMHAWQWAEARAAFEKAVAADPNDLETRLQFGRFLYFVGDDAGALAQWRRAQTIDPFYALAASWTASLLSEQGNLPDALAQIHRAIEFDSGAGGVKAPAPYVFLRAGDRQSAADAASRLATAPPWGGDRAYIEGKLGDTVAVRAIVRELQAGRQRSGLVNMSLALAYLGLGDSSLALASLERATDVREIWPTFHRVSDPVYDPVRTSARWATLVRRVGLESVPHALP